jgi:predicted metalloprotease with PDZ domain
MILQERPVNLQSSKMRHITLLSTLLFVTIQAEPAFAQSAFGYQVDLRKPADDLFHVTLSTPTLAAADSIFSFTAFAPGVHQVLDFGRFVVSFKAMDANGKEIPTVRRSTNDWAISDPTGVAEIRYDMQDSFDAEVEGNVVYPMSGTGIEPAYAAINTHGLFGYFVGHRSAPTTVELNYPRGWTVGTALGMDEQGRYVADSFYHLADSPILLGDLSTASRRLGDIEVQAYVYSPDPAIDADTVMAIADDVLQAAYEFIGYSPVDRYVFLMYFADEEARKRNRSFVGGGALEHSYSSTYALPAMPEMLHFLTDVVAHEFMHILTPLHLRSEIIAEWDYSRPTGDDKHLWLYEGVTEWTAHTMQLRGGMIDLEDYLRRMSDKIERSNRFNSDWSLARLSAEWFTDEGHGKYGDIYQLGPVTAMCLDLRLLELSNGERGLRDVFVEMMNRYGKSRPFDNETFFDEFVAATYPEIETFVDDHILHRRPLDFDRFMEPVGVDYIESRPDEGAEPQFGLQLSGTEDGRLTVSGFAPEHVQFGLQKGDIILRVFDEDVTIHNSDSVFAQKEEMRPGDEYPVRVLRGEEQLDLTGRLVPSYEQHVFVARDEITPLQARLRAIWTTNRAN